MMKKPHISYLISHISCPRSRAFTLIELLVSIAIFTLMTALVVAKYGTFNQSVLLTNLAYDMALTVRTAQTYGLSVRNTNPSSTVFDYAYGVHFDTSPAAHINNNKNQEIILFVDNNPVDGKYNLGNSEEISTYSIKRGAFVWGVCADNLGTCTASQSTTDYIDVTFKRPEPNAYICLNGSCNYKYAEITIHGTDGSPRTISIRENGQISVKD